MHRHEFWIYYNFVLDITFFIQITDAIENEKEVSKTIQIYNVDRAVCGRVAGVIAKKYGDTGFAGQVNLTYVFTLLHFLTFRSFSGAYIVDEFCLLLFSDLLGVLDNPLLASLHLECTFGLWEKLMIMWERYSNCFT